MSQDKTILSRKQITDDLTARFQTIAYAEPATDGDGNLGDYAAMVVLAQVKSGILSEVAKFLGEHAGLLPDKAAVIEAVNVGIDTLLALSGRPFLTRLIGPSVRKLIASTVDSIYEAILNPPAPRTEV